MARSTNLYNDIDTDFKAVSKAAELFEYREFDIEQLSVLPVGSRRSVVAREINGYSKSHSSSMKKDHLVIEVNREGLYDMLPEGVFHSVPQRGAGIAREEMLRDAHLRRNEEKSARKFFMPFEAELNHLRIVLEWYENRLDKKADYNDLSAIFREQWKELDELDNYQRVIWMHLLPVIHIRRNDAGFLSEILSILFNISIKAKVNSRLFNKIAIPKSEQFTMGKGALGNNTIIGSSFISPTEAVDIGIGPAPLERLIDFLPGTIKQDLINTVVGYLMPVETEVSITLIRNTEDVPTTLGKKSASSFLGFTAYL